MVDIAQNYTLAALTETESLSLLAVNPGLIIWTFIIFGLVFLILQKYAWRPIARALDERAQKIEQDIARSEQLKQEAEQKLATYEGKLKAAQSEADKIIAKNIKEAQEIQKDMIATARKETVDMLESAKSQILEERLKAEQEIRQIVIDMSIDLASKIIAREVSMKDHHRLLDEGLKNLQKTKLKNGI